MTPNDIEILIHCYVSPVKHPRFEHIEAVLQSFESDELVIHVADGVYQTTRKGEAHVRQLCSLPIPELKFIRYDGKEIIF